MSRAVFMVSNGLESCVKAVRFLQMETALLVLNGVPSTLGFTTWQEKSGGLQCYTSMPCFPQWARGYKRVLALLWRVRYQSSGTHGLRNFCHALKDAHSSFLAWEGRAGQRDHMSKPVWRLMAESTEVCTSLNTESLLSRVSLQLGIQLWWACISH